MSERQIGAGLGQRLEAGGDVDAVAEDVAFVDDDVADVDADAKHDPAVVGDIGIALDHAALNVDSAAHGIDRAGEFDQDPIAGRLDDAALMFGDLGVDELAPASLERRERALLVSAHQPAVADDIGRKDSGEPPYDALIGHKRVSIREFESSLWSGLGLSPLSSEVMRQN